MTERPIADPTPQLKVVRFQVPLPHPRMPYVRAQIVHVSSRKVVAEFVDPELAELFMLAAYEHNGLMARIAQLGQVAENERAVVSQLEATLHTLRPLVDDEDTPEEREQFHQIADFAQKHMQTSLYGGRPVTDPLTRLYPSGQPQAGMPSPNEPNSILSQD